jgi:hypothetical protein
MIFIPTGYTPARKMPVRTRRTRAEARPFAKTGMRAVENAARKEETAIRRGAGMMSERFNRAETRAPITKPAWTDIVSQARPESSRDQACASEATTAEAENQTAIPSISARERSTIVRHFVFI